MRATISIALLFVFCALSYPAVAAAAGLQSRDSEAQSPAAESADLVELNSADKAALESLPGIGPRTAELIIEYRAKNGGFEKVEDLMNVRGIGERTFLRLRELVRVDAGAGER